MNIQSIIRKWNEHVPAVNLPQAESDCNKETSEGGY